jgi:TRAP-type C4-dicarboxylate transport system permease large subunit
VSLGALNRELWGMLAVQIVVLMLITMVPAFSLWLPRLLSGH